MDMAIVALGAAWHVYLWVWYWAVVVVCLLCYIAARLCKDPNISSWLHCGIHIIANIGNIILFLSIEKNT